MDRNTIFRFDGTLRGLSFAAASKTRGAVIQLSLGRGTDKKVVTSLIVDGKDFSEVYDHAVDMIASYYGPELTNKMRLEMYKSKNAFLSAYGLNLRKVCFEQVFLDK